MAQRRQHEGAFKTRVVVAAIAGHKTVIEIASAYAIHPSQVGKWKSQALACLPQVLSDTGQISDSNFFSVRIRPRLSMKSVMLNRPDRNNWAFRLPRASS